VVILDVVVVKEDIFTTDVDGAIVIIF